MTIAPKVPLPNFLATVILFLVHPTVARIRHAAVRLAPVKVLALVGAVVALTVLEALLLVGELLGVGLGVGGELVIPDEVAAGVPEALGGVVAGW